MIYNKPLSKSDSVALQRYLELKYRPPEQAIKAGARATSPPTTGLRFWLDASDIDADPKTKNPVDGTVSAWKDKIAGVTLTAPKSDLEPAISTLGPKDAAALAFNSDFLIGPLGDTDFASDEEGAIVVVYSATHNHEAVSYTHLTLPTICSV